MKAKQLFLFVAFFCGYITSSMAQYENVWAFPRSAGMDFNNGSPVAMTTAVSGFGQSCASVCDSSGKLLFYTEGDTLWDRKGNIMPNGKGLNGQSAVSSYGIPGWYDYGASSGSAQGTMIVPMPDSAGKYYVFSLSSTESDNPGRLVYSVVDINLNNGMGDVVPGRKSILLDSSLTERMTGVVGNECNVWVIVEPTIPSGSGTDFRAYEITSGGINPAPVVSSVPGIPPPSLLARKQGQISISPNREKLAVTQSFSGNLELYDFDPNTGKVSNQTLLDTAVYTYGACFSPNSSILYVNYYAINKKENGIVQFDLSSGKPADMIKSKLTVDSLSWNASPMAADLKLGPDKKIYYHTYDVYHSYPGTPGKGGMISAIQFPDSAGLACKPVDSVLMFPNPDGSGYDYYCLPNVVPVVRHEAHYSSQQINRCASDQLKLSADSTSGWDYVWNDGTTGPERTVDTSGTYWVTYHLPPCKTYVDTFVVNTITLDPIVKVSGFILSTAQTYATYQWLLNGNIIPGATQSTYTVTQNGNYQVIVSDENGCRDTSAVYEIKNVTGIKDIYGSHQIKVYPNPVQGDLIYIDAPLKVNAVITGVDGSFIKAVNNATSVSCDDLAAGIYLLHILDQQGTPLKIEKIVKVNKN